jgi:transposase
MVVVETTSEGATPVGKPIINLSSVTTVGLDLAKHVFQVHCVDASGRVVVAKAIRRNKLLEFFASLPPCLVGLEASGSAHHWARELIKLGHEARMMPPAYVKPYIRRQKNDASDASAICEAVTRPSMRFVAVRSLENQAALMRHKAREMLVSQRTQLLNGLRGHLTEIGVIAAQGPRHARELAELIEACDETIPFEVCEALAPLVVQLRNLDDAIARLDRTIAKLALKDETARRLMSIPGFGPITASAMAATVQDTSSFAGPREFAAFLGLTPKQNSSGGKPKLGRISKMGNRNLRKLLVVGAHAVLFHRKLLRCRSPEARAQTERIDAGRFRDSGKESERARRARPENPDAMARNRGASKTRCRATKDRLLITTSCPKRLRGAHASSDAGSHPAPVPHLDSWLVVISTIASFSVG